MCMAIHPAVLVDVIQGLIYFSYYNSISMRQEVEHVWDLVNGGHPQTACTQANEDVITVPVKQELWRSLCDSA